MYNNVLKYVLKLFALFDFAIFTCKTITHIFKDNISCKRALTDKIMQAGAVVVRFLFDVRRKNPC
jgi:hypothetical protein